MTKTATKSALKTTTTLTGKRAIAFVQIAPLSYSEDKSRAASLANMRQVLGGSPSADEVKLAKTEWIIGRVASRLPVTARPKTCTDDATTLEFARQLVTQYAAPPKEGVKAKALRKGQLGRRTATQHKVVRAAEEAASVFLAELNLSNAKTNAQRDAEKATRAPSMAGSGKGKAQPEAPSHTQLVKPAAPVSSDDYVQHYQTQLAALIAYDKAHASKRPTTHGAFAEALIALQKLATSAANDYAQRKAAAIAKAK